VRFLHLLTLWWKIGQRVGVGLIAGEDGLCKLCRRETRWVVNTLAHEELSALSQRLHWLCV